MSSPNLHSGTPSPWMVDSETLIQLRLERAQSEFLAGRLSSALVEAEELLGEHPKQWDALRLVASAGLRMGNAVLAAEAYQTLLAHSPDEPALLAGMAVAQFGLSALDASEHLARKALSHDDQHPQAWYCLALVLERTGRMEEADRAFQLAHTVDPNLYPLRPSLSVDVLTDALVEARSGLGTVVHRFYEDVLIRWAEFPVSEELRVTLPPLSPFVEALYDGRPPTSGDPWAQLPSSVRLFTGNLAWGDTRRGALVERIQIALTREAHHWLGLSPVLTESVD